MNIPTSMWLEPFESTLVTTRGSNRGTAYKNMAYVRVPRSAASTSWNVLRGTLGPSGEWQWYTPVYVTFIHVAMNAQLSARPQRSWKDRLSVNSAVRRIRSAESLVCLSYKWGFTTIESIRIYGTRFAHWSTSKSELQFRSKRSIRPVINRTTKSAGSISIGPIWSDHSVRQVLSRIGVAAKWRRIWGQTLVESDEPVLIQKQSALVVPFKSEWTSCSD